MKVSFLAPDDWTIYNFKMPVVRKIKEEGNDVTIITPYGDNVSKFKDEGYEWREWKLDHHSMNPVKELVSIADLLRIYIKEKPDIAHHYTAKGILYGSIAAQVSSTNGIINAVTGGVSALGNVVSKEKWVYKAIKRVLESAYRNCLSGTEVIFQNPDDMEYFLDKGIVGKKNSHLVNGSGASLEKFTVKEEVDDGNTTVVLAGRLIWDKGIGEFVEASRIIQSQGEEIRLVLVGEAGGSNPKAVSEDQIRRWEREGVIEWWGFCEDMPSVFQKADIVCSPTYYREGVPKVLIEAAASGRPIVTTDMPGCREIVRDGHNGLLVPPKDPEALAEALVTLANTKSMRRRMGLRGREIVEEEFSVKRVVEQTMHVYDKLRNDIEV